MRIIGTSIFYHWLIMGESWKWHDLRSPISKILDIKIVDTYICPYYTLRVSKSLDLWYVFKSLWKMQLEKRNFEKCNLRSGHLIWPEGVIFGVTESSFFFGNVIYCWLNSEQLWQLWRRCAPPFFAVCEKPEGVDNRPRPRAGLSPGYHGSATNDIRVRSCSVDFDQK